MFPDILSELIVGCFLAAYSAWFVLFIHSLKAEKGRQQR